MGTYYISAAGSDGAAGTSLGAAWATHAHAISVLAGGSHTVYVDNSAGTLDISAGLSCSGGDRDGPITFIGINGSPVSPALVRVRATAAITMLTLGSDGWNFKNHIFDGNSTATKLVNGTGGFGSCVLTDCEFRGCATSNPMTTSMPIRLIRGWITKNTGGGQVVGDGFIGHNSAITDNTGDGWSGGAGRIWHRGIIANNTGVGGALSDWPSNFLLNAVYGNGGTGLSVGSYSLVHTVHGNIFVLNGGYGVDGHGNDELDYNAFYGNTSGARNGPAAGDHDIALSGNPFVNPTGTSSAADLAAVFACFQLNTIAGAGAYLRGSNFPLYGDIGPVQHQDPTVIVTPRAHSYLGF